eukprot:445347-Rhodomonas_salina.2
MLPDRAEEMRVCWRRKWEVDVEHLSLSGASSQRSAHPTKLDTARVVADVCCLARRLDRPVLPVRGRSTDRRCRGRACCAVCCAELHAAAALSCALLISCIPIAGADPFPLFLLRFSSGRALSSCTSPQLALASRPRPEP